MDWQTSEDTVPSAFITEANRRSMLGTPPTTGAWREGDAPGDRLFQSIGALSFESGQSLPHVRMAYETWGTLSPTRDNAVLVVHALTGDSHVVGRAGPQQAGDSAHLAKAAAKQAHAFARQRVLPHRVLLPLGR